MPTLFGDAPRAYEASHPWITFGVGLGRLSPTTWLLFGEAHSKVQHVSGVALRPDVSRLLNQIYLSKGVHATTAIEGNTLTEEQVRQIIEDDLRLPPSQDYLELEVRNILDACNAIIEEIRRGEPNLLTPARIKEFNAKVLHGLDVESHVVPGEVRTHPVGVLDYRGAPAEDCDYLLERLCSWLNGPDFTADDSDPYAFTKVLMKAVLAHLYIAWIHPFGDGNGRTARLIEFQVLVESGVPIPASHVLSDHYNRTRSRYYQVLSRTSKPPYPVTEFVDYALSGFVDELRGQLDLIRRSQLDVTWENYVHEQFRDQETPARRRQKHLVLDLPADQWTPRSALRRVSPRTIEDYAGKTQKTVTRDINELKRLDLVIESRQGLRPNRGLVLAFLPVRADGPIGGVDL